MSQTPDNFLQTALSLPQQQRADLAVQLLQSLDPPGDEISADQFGAQLQQRIEASRRGEIGSHTLEETREIVAKKLSEGRQQ